MNRLHNDLDISNRMYEIYDREYINKNLYFSYFNPACLHADIF